MIVKKEKTGFLRLFILALAVLIVQNNYAQAPADYYDSATGSGYTLKTQLYNIIDGHTSVSYTPGLWDAFYTTDERSDGYVWDTYSNCDFTFGTDQDNGTEPTDECTFYNREHSFPREWFGGAVAPMNTDIFHIYPTSKVVNSARASLPYGETNSPTFTSINGSKVGPSSYSGYTGTVFEPIDEYKGDFARTYFYMVTRYENLISSWPGSAMLDGSNDKCFTDWALELLIQWSNNDPVSQKEIDRNNAIYAIQNNRNPFIDHSEYVAKIWGGVISNNPPSISGIILNPASPKSTDPVNVSATITDSDGTITSAILKWGLVSGNLSNTINLTKISGNTYSTVSAIPAQTDGVAVYYKIEATDDSSDVAITNEHYYTVSNAAIDIIILDEDFTTCPATGWINYSISGTENWECGTNYMQVNAYGSTGVCNDWLISPAQDLDSYENEILSFKSWTKYTDTYNPPIYLKYSTNYSGSGDPSSATWTSLSATWSPQNSEAWTGSGNIDISGISGAEVYFAFQYISSGTGANTCAQWEIDDILIIGDEITENIAPEISNINLIPTNPDENETVIISADISDSDGTISLAKILWGTSSGSYPNEISMSENFGTYSGIIPGQTGGTTIYFKISATDDEEANTLSSQYSYSVNTPGNLAPEISGLDFAPLTPTSAENVIVSATITDPDGTISSANIKWGTSTGVYVNTVSMTVSGDDYSGTIPAQADVSHIYFVVEAIDNLGGSTTSAEENYIVQDPANELPIITDVQFSPSNPTNKDSVLVTALINDSDGAISTAILKWKRNAEATVFEKEMSYDGIKYSAYIPVQEAGKTVYFMIIAEDDDNAQRSYMDGVYSVITSSGVENTNLLEEILIYPNPASEKLKIFFLNNERDIVIALLSMDGITIYNKIFDEVKGEVSLMLNKINPGLYILQITNQKSKVSQKIIIK